MHKALRANLTQAVPFWPLGLPAWDADTVCLGLRTGDDELVFVWDRDAEAAEFVLPGVARAEVLFPAAGAPWGLDATGCGLSVSTPAGIGARVLRVSRG